MTTTNKNGETAIERQADFLVQVAKHGAGMELDYAQVVEALEADGGAPNDGDCEDLVLGEGAASDAPTGVVPVALRRMYPNTLRLIEAAEKVRWG